MDALNFLRDILPPPLPALLQRYPACEELRLRAEQPSSLTLPNGNLPTDICLGAEELHRIFVTLCGGSVHTHEATLAQGYFTVGEAIRVGVAGRYTEDGKRVLCRLTALNIRIPRTAKADGSPIAQLMAKDGFSGGVLVYGTPGCGKTTLLRSVIRILSSAPYLRRVAVVDTRRELRDPEAMEGCICDFLEGVGKAEGIGMATRSLNPQILVCDEIGDGEESAVLSAQNTGVPLVASAHGGSFESLMRRDGICRLWRAGVFSHAVRVTRDGDRMTLDIRKGDGDVG